MKNIFLIIITLLLLGCQDGPKAAFNEDFEIVDSRTAIPFENIVGMYKLDNDTKVRYNLPLDKDLILDIKPDETFFVNNYVNPKTWKLTNKDLKNKIYYYSDSMGTTISCPKLTAGGVINFYRRKKDSMLALYIYTPPLKGQEHGDYLRYIKVK